MSKINHPAYNIWRQMRQRCSNPNASYYKWYGARGIKVCERWQTFENFIEDMGERPTGATLERIDNDGDYEPGNCRWLSRKRQSNNMRSNYPITYQGKTQTLSEWADEVGLKYFNLYNRVRRYGWPIARALTEPEHTK